MKKIASKSQRYLPKHPVYLADVLLLVRQMQAVAWPLNFHIALGGGVLDHGYSDKDVDIYVLPRYPGSEPSTSNFQHDYEKLIDEFAYALGTLTARDYNAELEEARERYGIAINSCFAAAVHFDKPFGIDIFVVRA
jgi:hypothetical protein